MLQTKACPRCDGDLYEENDLYGRYVSCLHCGYLEDADNTSGETEKSTDSVEESTARRAA